MLVKRSMTREGGGGRKKCFKWLEIKYLKYLVPHWAKRLQAAHWKQRGQLLNASWGLSLSNGSALFFCQLSMCVCVCVYPKMGFGRWFIHFGGPRVEIDNKKSGLWRGHHSDLMTMKSFCVSDEWSGGAGKMGRGGLHIDMFSLKEEPMKMYE